MPRRRANARPNPAAGTRRAGGQRLWPLAGRIGAAGRVDGGVWVADVAGFGGALRGGAVTGLLDGEGGSVAGRLSSPGAAAWPLAIWRSWRAATSCSHVSSSSFSLSGANLSCSLFEVMSFAVANNDCFPPPYLDGE